MRPYQERERVPYQQRQQAQWGQPQPAGGRPPAGGQQQPPPTGPYGRAEPQPPGPGGQWVQQEPRQYAQSGGAAQSTGAPAVTGQQWGTVPIGQPMEERMPLRPITVESIVETDVVTADPDTPIATVVSEMAEQSVGSVVVVEEGIPVGVVTDRSIALSLATDPDATDRRSGDLVGGTLVTGAPDMSVFDAIGRMRGEGIRRLPIVDEDRSLQGIVTLDDVLVLLADELGKATDVIEGQSRRR